MATSRDAPAGAATVSVAAAAQLLNVSRRTVLYLLRDGRVKGWRLPPRGWWRVSRDSLAGLGAETQHREKTEGQVATK